MSEYKYKYKKGDAVLIRNDLVNGNWYYMRSGPKANSRNNYATINHVKMMGQIVHISRISSGAYLIKEDNEIRLWTDDMFEGKCFECVCKTLI